MEHVYNAFFFSFQCNSILVDFTCIAVFQFFNIQQMEYVLIILLYVLIMITEIFTHKKQRSIKYIGIYVIYCSLRHFYKNEDYNKKKNVSIIFLDRALRRRQKMFCRNLLQSGSSRDFNFFGGDWPVSARTCNCYTGSDR